MRRVYSTGPEKNWVELGQRPIYVVLLQTSRLAHEASRACQVVSRFTHCASRSFQTAISSCNSRMHVRADS